MRRGSFRTGTLFFTALLAEGTALAAGIPGSSIEQVVVTADRKLAGELTAASEGVVLPEQLETRPILRTAELLEVVPGLIVTQHSGAGKANQYFLRGFNLDHGTDFATFVEGMPVNMPTHGHGQGYSDLNFMIPELVSRLDYRKGTYYGEHGNFSAAGAVSIRYKRALERPFLTLSLGEFGFERALLAGSTSLAGGDLLLAGDLQRDDGPWLLRDDLRKTNAFAKYSRGDADRGWNVSFMGYDSQWRSTDQIPQRAVLSGELDRFGYIDPTDGGESYRYSLSADAWGQIGAGDWHGTVYAMDYHLDLISNFTYFMDAVNADQFEQTDDRRVFGGDWRYQQSIFGPERPAELAAGVQIRYDDIDPVGLYHTTARDRTSTVRADKVKQASYAAFASVEVRWTSWLRNEIGLRADRYTFDVRSDLLENSGRADDSIVSPKLSFAFGPWASTEVFANFGRGFHSNDARGTTITVDPNDGVTPVQRVDALARATGSEIGARTAIIPKVHLAASLWRLALDSELVFVGDGGTTEASRPTRRRGFELSAYYTPTQWMIVDADLAWSRARFTDADAAGNFVPGAVERVASLGIAVNNFRGFFGGVRARYLGPAALIEDGSVHSSSTTLMNVEVGYRFSKRVRAELGLFNALDARANDIAYFYESQLRGEAEPVSDIHFHPVEPRTLRVSATVEF